jgi:hypothetical protein
LNGSFRLNAFLREAWEIMKEKEKKSSKKREKWLGATVGLLLLIALFNWRPPDKHVPDELVGQWHTADPNYSDRWFDIDPVLIDFGTGGATVSTGFIKEVKAVSEGNRIRYTITYLENRAPKEVSLYYDSGDGGTVRFQHQESTIWKKDQ